MKIIIFRDGGSLHEDAAHNAEILGSEDGRGSDDDQASESVPLASSLFNYQSFMDKRPSGKWTKQDTELFYEVFVEGIYIKLFFYWNLFLMCLLFDS